MVEPISLALGEIIGFVLLLYQNINGQHYYFIRIKYNKYINLYNQIL
jgi:hypothetical protein